MPTPQKPDWAERKVVRQVTGYHWNGRLRKSTVILPDIATKLLRAEHRRAVRVVKQHQLAAHKRKWGNPVARLGYLVACADILAALKRGRT